jgi:hypothetical protein
VELTSQGSFASRALHQNSIRGINVGTSGDVNLAILGKIPEILTGDTLIKRQLSIGGLTLGGPEGGISGGGIELKGNGKNENKKGEEEGNAPAAEVGNEEPTTLQGEDILQFLSSIQGEETIEAAVEEAVALPAAGADDESAARVDEEVEQSNKAVEESEKFSEGFGITLDQNGKTANLGGNLGITTGSDGSTSVGGSNGINIASSGEATIEGNETE